LTGHAFAFRAPWYVRERENIGLRDAAALRPAIQMYDSPRFVDQVTTDPRVSLKFTPDDRWSYPVPVALSARGPGREKFATHKMVRTGIRKLYQPNHDRFYLVVAELFCDEPGLPRAGPHRDVTVNFAMRRRHVMISGPKSSMRRLARDLIVDLAKEQHDGVPVAAVAADDATDVADLWWADVAARERFSQGHADLLNAVTGHVDVQSWLVNSTTGKGRWAVLSDKKPQEAEQTFRMWRLPDRPDTCAAANTRSLWFGLVPTYSADHWLDPDPAAHGRPVPKLDDHAIYELVCSVTQPQPAGQEHCPPKIWWSAPTQPFRLAAAYDPEGTKNRQVSITAPDFRALAARAGQPAGPGGLAINTPPGSHMNFNPFGSFPPAPGSGSTTGGAGVCTFAFELFFIVALFLFLMFLPIVVFVFQLWWMLALRFCFIRLTGKFSVLTAFFAKPHVDVLADLQLSANAKALAAMDAIMGVTQPPPPMPPSGPGIVASLAASPDFAVNAPIRQDIVDLVTAVDPALAVAPTEPAHEAEPKDPLCPGS
jgi:hypothetical protein